MTRSLGNEDHFLTTLTGAARRMLFYTEPGLDMYGVRHMDVLYQLVVEQVHLESRERPRDFKKRLGE